MPYGTIALEKALSAENTKAALTEFRGEPVIEPEEYTWFMAQDLLERARLKAELMGVTARRRQAEDADDTADTSQFDRQASDLRKQLRAVDSEIKERGPPAPAAGVRAPVTRAPRSPGRVPRPRGVAERSPPRRAPLPWGALH